MPKNLSEYFEKSPQNRGINLFEKYGINSDSESSSKIERSFLRKAAESAPVNAILGAGDAFRNTMTGAASLLPGVNIKPIQSGKGLSYDVGNIAGNVGAFLGGGELVSGAKIIPKLSGLAKSISSNALFGAIQNPDDQLMGAAEGGALGAVGHGIGKLFGIKNPYARTLAIGTLGGTGGGLVGGGVGYLKGGQEGILPGAKTGAEIGAVGAPVLAFSRNIGNRAKSGLMSQINPDEIQSTMQASRDIGRVLRPTEVTGRPELSAMEGKVGIKPEDQKKLFESQNKGQQQEKTAIDKLLNTISKNNVNVSSDVRDIAKTIQSKNESSIKIADQQKIDKLLNDIHPEETDASMQAREAAKSVIGKQYKQRAAIANPLYEEANKDTIPDRELTKILTDANLSRRLNETISDTGNAYDLKNYSPNSMKVLDLMRQDISDEIRSAESRNNPDYKTARKLKQQLSKLDEILESAGEKIKTARATYRAESEPIDKLRDSAIGKIANLDDINLKNVASTIFDRKQTNIKSFNEIRDQFSKEDPELWRRILRNSIEDRLAKVKSGDPSAIFHKNILGSDRDFEQFHEAAKGMPDIQEKLTELRSQFPESSAKLKELRKPMIARLSKMDDSQLKNISKTIFDTNQTDTKMFSELRDQISEVNPSVWKSLIRNEMERRLSEKGSGVGTHFYKKILENKNSFDQFVDASKGMPDVQEKLTKMRDVFSKIIDPITPKIARDEARVGEAKGILSSTFKKTAQFVDNIISGKYDKGLIDLITDEKWDKKFNEVVNIKNKQMKAEKIGDLLAKITNATVNQPKDKKLMTMELDNYSGTQPQ